MFRNRVWVFLSACALASTGCADVERPIAPTAAQHLVLPYVVSPPPGKLPWPQHAPGFTRAQYDAMLNTLYIANNYGLYQGGPADSTTAYLHGGLDIVLPNGTPIYSVDSGYVRHINSVATGALEFYEAVIVQDAADRKQAWSYAHVSDFKVKVGDFVPRGTQLASVKFRGLDHVHLDRVTISDGGSWRNWYTLVHSYPDTFFVYEDTQKPIFVGRLRYFRNESNDSFARPADGSPPVVEGDVDIVAAIRDPGEHGHGTPLRFPDDRQAPARIEYSIAPVGGTAPRLPSFDFRALIIPRLGWRKEYQTALTVFKWYDLISPGDTLPTSDRRTPFYIVTNVPESGLTGPIPANGGQPSWRTNERDASGEARYPNGDYVVTIWAYDFKGNESSTQDTVRVRN